MSNDPGGLKIGPFSKIQKGRGKKRDRESTKRVCKGGRGEWYMLDAGSTQEVEYLARDPLGDEVAALSAKIQADLQRSGRWRC